MAGALAVLGSARRAGDRNSKVKCRAGPQRAFQADRAAAALDNPFDDAQSDARARHVHLLQSLKGAKNALVIVGVNADAVVLDRELDQAASTRARVYLL